MSELVNPVGDEAESTPELDATKARAETYGASISIGAYTVKDEVRISANIFAKDIDSANAIAENSAMTSARIGACSAQFAKFGKKTSSNVYVGKPTV